MRAKDTLHAKLCSTNSQTSNSVCKVKVFTTEMVNKSSTFKTGFIDITAVG